MPSLRSNVFHQAGLGSASSIHRSAEPASPPETPNPSIEGTSTIRLRLLAAAPHVKR